MTSEATETRHLLDSILGVLSRTFGEDLASVPADTPFFDLGADSLLMINVLREIEQEHHVKITMRELFDETGTPRLLAELVAARLPRQPGADPLPAAHTPQPFTRAPIPAQHTAPPSPGAPLSPGAAPAHTAPNGVAAPVEHAVADAVTDAGFVTRQELLELTRRVQQLSQIQLQMLTQISQLSQLLALQSNAAAALPNDEVAR